MKVERTVDGVERGGIDSGGRVKRRKSQEEEESRGGRVKRRVLSRAIVLGMSYCSRGCIVRDVVLFDLIWTSRAIVDGDRKGRWRVIVLGKNNIGGHGVKRSGHSRWKTIGFVGLALKLPEVNMICSISQTVNTKCSDAGHVHALFLQPE